LHGRFSRLEACQPLPASLQAIVDGSDPPINEKPTFHEFYFSISPDESVSDDCDVTENASFPGASS
jgi:hypothetical protein